MTNQNDKNVEEIHTDPTIDFYRDTPVRYLGYANEVGEAFRAQFGSGLWIRSTYGLAIAYVLADTADKSWACYKKHKNTKHLTITASDTLTWQMLASVIIPGFTINRLCARTQRSLTRFKRLPVASTRWIATAVGLLAIPIIIKPIDIFTDHLLDLTLRKYFYKID